MTASTDPGADPPLASSTGGHAVLDCANVVHGYPKPGGGWQTVLSDVSVRVPRPDFLSVVGPSGCGKSTLLRLILGSETPTGGSVRANGESIEHPDRRRGIVFQRYSLFPHLTVLENVVFGLELDGTWLLQKWLTWPWYRRTHHKRYVEQAMAYLGAVKLAEHAAKFPHQLSGGMQQRVAIAQAMVMKPDVLLMDEPFGALDPGTREALQVHVLETFLAEKVTVFFVTHDLEEAVFVGNRLLVLSPFWRNEDGSAGEGAKLVMDLPTPKGLHTDLKQTPEFQQLVARARAAGFDPKRRLAPSEFEVDPPR